MNQHLNYHLAQAHTADLIREANATASPVRRRRPRRPRTAIRRIVDSVPRAGRHYERPDRNARLKLGRACATSPREKAEVSRFRASLER